MNAVKLKVMKKQAIKLITGITLMLFFTLLSIFGCTIEEEPVVSLEEIEHINYGTSFGFCSGYCVNTIRINTNEVTLKKTGTGNNLLPEITYKEVLEPTVLEELFDKIDFDAFLALDKIIGCPDCADGGTEWIEIKTKNKTHKVTFEYFTNEIETLIDIINPLRELNNSLQKDAYLVIDNNTYNNTSTDNYTINNVSLTGDILRFSITASGCSSNSWTVNLVDSEDILESSPLQRKLKINLLNNELCLAIFTKTYEINIAELQVEGENKIHLNIEGLNEHIEYNY